MASPTKVVKVRRANRKIAAGKARKNKLRNDGTTAALLPLDKPNANEKAQATARAAAKAKA